MIRIFFYLIFCIKIKSILLKLFKRRKIILHKDELGNWIGIGEDSALIILKMIFKKSVFDTQVKLSKILAWHKYTPEHFTQRNQKETIDIFMGRFYGKTGQKFKSHAIRIQDTHHIGDCTATADRHQKDLLEQAGVIVVDLHQRDCRELFKERVNHKSIWEVCNGLISAGVKPQ